MLKIILTVALLTFGAMADDEDDEEEYEGYELEGFLTTKQCADLGVFKDCYLENYSCGSDDCYKDEKNVGKDTQPQNIVMYVHDENRIYLIDVSKVKASEIDEGINRNLVTVRGELDEETNTIHATEFVAPPPPKKSFFKGCL